MRIDEDGNVEVAYPEDSPYGYEFEKRFSNKRILWFYMWHNSDCYVEQDFFDTVVRQELIDCDYNSFDVIVPNMIFEAPFLNVWRNVDAVLKKMGVPDEKVIFLDGSSDRKFDKRHVTYPYFINSMARYLHDVEGGTDNDIATTEYNLLYLVRQIRPTRLMFNEFIYKNLSNYRMSCATYHYLPDDIGMVNYYAPSLVDKVPMYLDGEAGDATQHKDVTGLFRKAMFNFVAESSTSYPRDYVWNRRFMTEKTFKPFAWSQIPIYWTVPGHVKLLRNLGFDMFDDFIDHSYDDEKDTFNRMEMIKDQLIRADEFVGAHAFRKALRSRFIYNKKVLRSVVKRYTRLYTDEMNELILQQQ